MNDNMTAQAQKTEAELEKLIEALCAIPAPLGQGGICAGLADRKRLGRNPDRPQWKCHFSILLH